jgi:hypothetical protein
MGRGPPEAIMRKLIRKYFKFDLKKKSMASASKYLVELQEAWTKYGMDSKEAADIQAKIDAANEKDEKDYIALKKSVKQYPTMMNQFIQSLSKPKSKDPLQHHIYSAKTILEKEAKDPFKDIKF